MGKVNRKIKKKKKAVEGELL